MSEQESEGFLFQSTNSKISRAKISLKLSSTGHIHVDWTNLPKHRNTRQCVIHYKSLNTSRSHAIPVSRKKSNFTLPKLPAGHLYEIHVCTVDRSNRILASTDNAQIQTKTSNQTPILRVTKSTPDFIWLEWDAPDDVKLSDIESYRVLINDQPKAALPATETRFVVNDGKLGKRYNFQLDMLSKDGKVVSSLPVRMKWPAVTIPEHHVFINGCEELIICWGESKSINDGSIESYMLYLYDADNQLLNTIGPNTPQCHQVWIKDVTKGIYYYILEIKLAHSKKSLYTKRKRIECGRETRAPILSYKYADSYYRDKLLSMAYHLLRIRENIKSNHLRDKCEKQLKQILSIFNALTDSLRLVLTIESQSSENYSKSYQLLIDDKQSNVSIPGFVKEFPLQLPRRNKPYELSLLITPDSYDTTSKKVLVEASGQLPFFCAHFNQQRSIVSCSYLTTLEYEKRLKRSVHQGLLKSSQPMTKISVYDLSTNQSVDLPSFSKGHRLTIVLFYTYRCVSSITHLNYLSTYASSHRQQYNYISINCTKDNIDDLQSLTQTFKDIQCYTEFPSPDVESEQNEDQKPLHEVLSLDGVPTYFILNFSNRITWKGRLCVQDAFEYTRALDHILAESQQQPCSADNCELCVYQSMDETKMDSELTSAEKNLEAILQQQSLQITTRQLEGNKENRSRTIVSLKHHQENI